MTTRSVLLVAAAAASLASGALAQTFSKHPVVTPTPVWTELGPAPIDGVDYTGRVSAMACSPVDANVYFGAGADGGVWRTGDGGQSWTPLTDFMPTTAIGALAIDPGDPDVIYAGTGESNYANHSRYGLGLLRSTDGGDTWQQLAANVFSGRCFSNIVVDHANPDIVYASITRAGGFPELVAAKGHPGATGDLGVFKSLDQGVTWTRLTGIPNLSTTSLAMDPANSSILYAGVGRIFGASGNGVYRSTNGGATWTLLGGGLPSGSSVGRITVAVAPSNPNRVYALLTNPSSSFGSGASTLGGYRSNNGGATWVNVSPGSIQSSYGWYLSVVSVHPTDPDTVFMGGLTLSRSINAGASWSTVTPPHVDLHALAWDAAGRLLVGDDGGVQRSTDLGSSWIPRNDGLGLIQFYAGLSTHPTQDLVFYGGTQDNGTNRRTTSGQSWDHIFGGDGGWTQVDQANPARVFVEFQGVGNLYLSSDGGSSFGYSGSGLAGRNAFLPPFLIDPTNSNRMYYGSHYISRSTNGGASWSAISGDLTTGSGAIRSLAIAPSDSSVLWAATNDGNVAISTNSGVSWNIVRSGNPGWPRVTRELFIHPERPLSAWLAVAAFGTDQILHTSDGGASWTPRDGDLPDIPVNTVAAIPNSPLQLFAGTDDGLYLSIDNGVHWKRYGTKLPRVPVIDIRLQLERGRLIVATQGRGVWSATLTLRPATLLPG